MIIDDTVYRCTVTIEIEVRARPGLRHSEVKDAVEQAISWGRVAPGLQGVAFEDVQGVGFFTVDEPTFEIEED